MSSRWIDQVNAMLGHSQTDNGARIQQGPTRCTFNESDTSRPRSKRRGVAKLMASLTPCGDGHGATGGLFHLTCSVTILPGEYSSRDVLETRLQHLCERCRGVGQAARVDELFSARSSAKRLTNKLSRASISRATTNKMCSTWKRDSKAVH